MRVATSDQIDTGVRRKWMYTTVSGDPGTMDAKLNTLGEQGWEAVDSHMSGGCVFVLLKRAS